MSIDDVNAKLDYFIAHFFHVLDRHAPIRKKEIRQRHCPFVDKNIKELMAKRDRANKNARATGSAADWQIYPNFRNNVKRALLDAERNYVERQIKNYNIISARWKVIRNCIPPTEKSQPVYSKDMKELANEFNEFFSTVGVRAAFESKNLAAVNNVPSYTCPQYAIQIIQTMNQTNFGFVQLLQLKLRKSFNLSPIIRPWGRTN